VTVVAIFPHVYGDRLVMPLYLLLVPYVAVALVAVARLGLRVGVERRTAALCAITTLGGVWAVAPQLVDWDLPVTAIAVVCAAMLLADGGPQRNVLWFSVAFAAALTASLLLAPSPAATIEYRRQLAFIAIAPAVTSLATSGRATALATGGLAAILALGAFVSRDVWIPLLVSRLHAIDGVPIAFQVAALVLGAAFLLSAKAFGWRTPWRSIGAMIAGAFLTIVTLQRFAVSRTALDVVDMHVNGWPAAAALLGDHRWFGAGLAAAAPLAAVHIESGGAILWFIVSVGIVGTSAYLAVWLRALWATGVRLADWRFALFHGLLLGAFASLQDYNIGGGASAAPGVLLLIGIVVGLAGSSDVSTIRVEPRPS